MRARGGETVEVRKGRRRGTNKGRREKAKTAENVGQSREKAGKINTRKKGEEVTKEKKSEDYM